MRLLISAWIAVASALAATPGQAAFEVKDASWEGTSELGQIARDRLGKARVRIVPTILWDEIQPADAILALHPTEDIDYREVAAFLAAGGRVGVLDDYGKGDSLLRRFRIHRVRAPLEPKNPLRDNPNLAVAVPTLGADGRPHPVVAGVERLVTNHPTCLETEPGLRLTSVLELRSSGGTPASLALIGVIGDAKRCGLVSDGAEEPASGGPAATGRCGRLFAMGDPSVVINLMLRYPGNRAFASRLVEYLVGDDTWGRRGGNLYIVTNAFTQQGSFGKRAGLTGAIDERLEALARLVSETRREGLPPPLALLLAAIAAGGAAFWAVGAATRRYRRAAPRYARPTPLVAQGGLAGRAAVLGADTTQRALAVLELKSALEEALRERLKQPGGSIVHLVEEIDRQDALSRRNSDALKALVREMTRVEGAVTRTERIRIEPAALRKMHDAMTAILSELDEGRSPEP